MPQQIGTFDSLTKKKQQSDMDSVSLSLSLHLSLCLSLSISLSLSLSLSLSPSLSLSLFVSGWGLGTHWVLMNRFYFKMSAVIWPYIHLNQLARDCFSSVLQCPQGLALVLKRPISHYCSPPKQTIMHTSISRWHDPMLPVWESSAALSCLCGSLCGEVSNV